MPSAVVLSNLLMQGPFCPDKHDCRVKSSVFKKKKIVNKNGRIDIINKLLSEFRVPTVIYKHAGNASEKR